MTDVPPGPAARHVPVLLDRCVALLAPALQQPGSVVVDATLGMGGHSEALLERCPQASLVAIDRDPQAIELAGRRLERFADRVTLVHAVYDRLPEVLADLGLERVQGVLLDLGVSSLQLDEAARGFAYAQDAPLDMRMDPTAGRTAADVLNTYGAAELARVLRQYGEERFASRIAGAVVRERERTPFDRSARLVELVRAAVPAATRRTGGNPAKRTFQALRIEVNGELEVLERAMPAAVEALAVGGRIAVMSYHSLEDRLVKRVLAAGARSTAPAGLPVELPEHAPELRLLTRGAEQADAVEVGTNPRAASVRLRAAERLREPQGLTA
jgi:16S rRNA (cytosine1402-N4)-methyltransferase